MAFLKGTTLSLVTSYGPQKVEWKQGSILGIGGDMAEYYEVCDYKMQSSDKYITVFVHKAEGSPPQKLKVDSTMQYGMNDGIFFIVVHNKEKYKPYQHRFIRSVKEKILYVGAEYLKKSGVDVTWMAGDYLRDF